jgi:hypothetical protein
LPIVGKQVDGTRVSIFNASTLARHPLLALRFKNTSGVHLMQGPITVYENGTYAGDAKVLDVQPNEERLISYAIDLGTEVEVISNGAAPTPVAATACRAICHYSSAMQAGKQPRVIKVKLAQGMLHVTVRERMSKTYRAKNHSEQERRLILEHPFSPQYKLVSKEQPRERTAELYRFEVTVPAGKRVATTVIEERDVLLAEQLCALTEQKVRELLALKVCSEKVKATIKEILARQAKQSALQRELAGVQQQLAALTQDQVRLRANIKEMPASSAAYKRYLAKFDTQETEIEKLQEAFRRLSATCASRQAALDKYLVGLDVE